MTANGDDMVLRSKGYAESPYESSQMKIAIDLIGCIIKTLWAG